MSIGGEFMEEYYENKVIPALKQEMEVMSKNCFTRVFTILREDPELYLAWQANIAMAFMDNMHWAASMKEDENCENRVYTVTPEQLHQIANDAAKYFLNLLIKPIE